MTVSKIVKGFVGVGVAGLGLGSIYKGIASYLKAGTEVGAAAAFAYSKSQVLVGSITLSVIGLILIYIGYKVIKAAKE